MAYLMDAPLFAPLFVLRDGLLVAHEFIEALERARHLCLPDARKRFRIQPQLLFEERGELACHRVVPIPTSSRAGMAGGLRLTGTHLHKQPHILNQCNSHCSGVESSRSEALGHHAQGVMSQRHATRRANQVMLGEESIDPTVHVVA